MLRSYWVLGTPFPPSRGCPTSQNARSVSQLRRLQFRGHWPAPGAQQVREGLRSEPSSDPEPVTTEPLVIVSTSWRVTGGQGQRRQWAEDSDPEEPSAAVTF